MDERLVQIARLRLLLKDQERIREQLVDIGLMLAVDYCDRLIMNVKNAIATLEE